MLRVNRYLDKKPTPFLSHTISSFNFMIFFSLCIIIYFRALLFYPENQAHAHRCRSGPFNLNRMHGRW